MIQIFTTGGTIEGLDSKGEQEPKESNVSIESFLKNINVSFEYNIESLIKKDSRAIDSKDRELLVQKIKESKWTS